MEKKSVCKEITPGKPYANKHGVAGEMLYPWNIAWENGDIGQQSTKKNEAPYVVGQEYTYEIIVGTWADGKEKISFKKVDPNNKFKKKDPTIALKSYACSYATRLVEHDVIKPAGNTPEDMAKFESAVANSAKSFYKEMSIECNNYGIDNADVIGTCMSKALDVFIKGVIPKERIYFYYRNLLSAVLVKQQPQA